MLQNKFTAQEQGIKGAWSEVENQLQRRHDLIPNLVETTKGFAAQESSVFQGIADARAKMAGAQTPSDKIAAGIAESSAISRLLLVVENYPQLKSDATFMRLMDELAGTENRITFTRMRYNEQVQAYNTLRNQFPANLTGKLFGFKADIPVLRSARRCEGRAESGLQQEVVVPIVDGLLPEFDQEMAATRRVLERAPEAAFLWRPHEKSWTLGEICTHLSQIPHWGVAILTKDWIRPGATPGRGHRPRPPSPMCSPPLTDSCAMRAPDCARVPTPNCTRCGRSRVMA